MCFDNDLIHLFYSKHFPVTTHLKCLKDSAASFSSSPGFTPMQCDAHHVYDLNVHSFIKIIDKPFIYYNMCTVSMYYRIFCIRFVTNLNNLNFSITFTKYNKLNLMIKFLFILCFSVRNVYG